MTIARRLIVFFAGGGRVATAVEWLKTLPATVL